MTAIQAAITLCASIAIIRAFAAVRTRTIGLYKALVWVGLWSAGILCVWFPEATALVASKVGVGRGVDVILYLSIVVLSYLVFRLYVSLERQEQVITRLVSEFALQTAQDSFPDRND